PQWLGVEGWLDLEPQVPALLVGDPDSVVDLLVRDEHSAHFGGVAAHHADIITVAAQQVQKLPDRGWIGHRESSLGAACGDRPASIALGRTAPWWVRTGCSPRAPARARHPLRRRREPPRGAGCCVRGASAPGRSGP